MERRVLFPPAAAQRVGLSKSTLDKLRVLGGGPPFIRLGAKKVGYLREDLDQWLEGRRVTSTAERPA